MQIVVTGTNTKISEDELIFAVNVMSKQLMSGQLLKHLFIDIIFGPISKFHGLCDTNENNSGKFRDFDIYIRNSMSRKNQLCTLAHELVHVKQYATGELNPYIKNKKHLQWKKSMVDLDSVNYWDLPWEIEAHGKEPALYNHYLRSLKELND